MTNIVRRPRNEEAFFLEIPDINGQFSGTSDDGRGEKLYSQLDLDEAVAAALVRGREEATVEHQAYRGDLQRGYERAFDIIEEGSRQLQETRRNTTQKIGETILELTYRLAERVVRAELPQSQETLPRLLDELLARIGDAGTILVRVAPSDCRDLQRAQGTDTDRWKGFSFRSDEEIEEGGCLVETERGCWDARVKTQLAELYREISRVALEGLDESEAAA